MATQQVIVEFISDTSQLNEGEKKLLDIQKKTATAVGQTNTELAKLTKNTSAAGTASKSLADSTQKNAALYTQLTASLKTTTGEQKKFIENLLNTNLDQVEAEIRNLGLSTEQYVSELAKATNATGQNETAVVNVKQRYRELVKELNNLSVQGRENTAEFRALAKEAGELNDQIGDTNARIKALGSDTAAVDGLISAVGGLAGAFAAIQGAQALFADENEDLQKALLKVSAAMSLLQGIQQIQNVLQKESALRVGLLALQQKVLVLQTNLQTAAESKNIAIRYAAIVAQKILNAVMAANPIGLVVTAVVTLTAALIAFANSSKKAAEEQAKLNARLASAGPLLDAEIEAYERSNKKRVADLEKTNAKQSEIEKENLNNRKRILSATERELAELQKAIDQSSAEEKEEALAKKVELEKNAADLRVEVYVQEAKLVKTLDEEDKERKEKALADRTKKEEEAAQRREERAKAEIDAAKQLQDIRNKIILDGITNEFEKRRVAVQQQLANEIRDVQANELIKAETRDSLIKSLNEKAAQDLAAINADQRNKEMEAEKQFQTELADLTEQIKLNSIKDIGERELQAIRFNYARQRTAILEDTTKTYQQKAVLIEALGKIEAEAIRKQEQENRKAAAAERLKTFDDVIKDTTLSSQVRLKAIVGERVALVNLYAQGVLSREEYNDKLRALAGEEAQINKASTDDFKAKQKERLDAIKAVVSNAANLANSTIGIIDELFKQQSERQLQGIEDQKKRVQELNETGAITAKEAERRLKRLDAEERKIKTEQAKRDKSVALFQAVVNTASAIVEALPNIPLSIAAGVLGAAQIALIAARPIPKFAKGKKDSYQGLGEVGEAGPEIVQVGNVKYLANKPTIVWLNKEDKVYTAKETRNMLSKSESVNNNKEVNNNQITNNLIRSSEINTEVLGKEKQVISNRELTIKYTTPIISIAKGSGYIPTVDRSVTQYNQSQQTPVNIPEIDYEKMGETMAKNIPQYGMMVNEKGFTEFIRTRNAFTQYLNKRRAG
jgi:hypothetical protein